MDTAGAAPVAPAGRDGLRAWVRALGVVFPWWFLVLALAGAAWAGAPLRALAWSAPVLAATLLPAALAYVEPRVLLLLVPLGCVLAGRAAVRIGEVTARNPAYARAPAVAVLAVAALLAIPTGRDLARAWGQGLPLQRAASARRAAGEALRAKLAPDAIVVSWHPAIAVYARREWRVMPYDGFERILGYARFQGASAVVFSTLEPSPLRSPPSAFTVVLVDGGGALPSGPSIRLEPVEQTPLLFVGRLAPEPVR